MAKDRFLAQGVTTTKRQRNGKPVNSSSSKKDTRRANKATALKNIDDSEDDDDVIGDVDNLEHTYGADRNELSSDDEFLETAAEKRLRLAKEYIGKVKVATDADTGEFDAAQIDRDLIAERLLTDARERSGRWSRRIAAQFAHPVDSQVGYRALRNGHRLPVTCVAITPDGHFVYSGGKDGSLVKWDRVSGKKLKVFSGQKKKLANHNLGHCDHILAIAMSSDGKYVATGGRDRRIHIWSVQNDVHLGVFHQHKDAVTGLVFRRGYNHLYSCSADRMVKLWNIDDMGYMDTLFGHQDGAVAIDALQREQAVTIGGRDRTLRLWKIADESQLVFRGGTATDQRKLTKMLKDDDKTGKDSESNEKTPATDASLLRKQNPDAKADIEQHRDLARRLARDEVELREQCLDAVAMIDEETFVTGSDSGALSLWSIHKKKPVFVHHVSHGVHQDNTEAEKISGGDEETAVGQKNPVRPRWITALAAVPFTDLLFSASSDGFIRMWQLRSGKAPGFDLVNVVPVAGYVNGLAVCELPSKDQLVTKKDIVLTAAVGQEPRLGRWAKEKARNVVKVFHFPSKHTVNNKA
ncbi:pre-rRNA processing protein [Coemansia spiralis]|uniref:Pre-rRNA processing protein n=2 Tax=Coemansia TaxID=4863 RepID=A0A9W8G7H6_9FUNG|nr:pre-rRNA processing protein [Coemansia umbellata]KAJ2620897.1 pre-rRNA processing protein [Coemansia sp. RSA 1358]KAJ2675471.1 pre-rRNA processing protein [Coemansia spiralis]